jgi:hypothetical protein
MGAIPHTEIAVKTNIQLYGWDSGTGIWSGPTEFAPAGRAVNRLLGNLQEVPVKSWFGPLKLSVPGEPAARFFVVIHDRDDCAVAMLYCADSKAGPVEVVAVVPAGVRHRLRPEFAFEFLAFANFLGAIGESAAITVQDRITEALEQTEPGDSMVFSLSTGMWPGDCDPLLSECIETVATSMLLWLGDRA